MSQRDVLLFESAICFLSKILGVHERGQQLMLRTFSTPKIAALLTIEKARVFQRCLGSAAVNAAYDARATVY